MAESESKRNVKRIENRKAKDSKRELVSCNIAREKINRKSLAYLINQYLSSIPYKMRKIKYATGSTYLRANASSRLSI